jgi:hypothetical protein
VVAAIDVVHPVRRALQFVGGDRLPAHPPVGAETAAVVELGRGERRRDGSHRQGRLGTKRLGCHRGEQRRVGSPAERHDDPFQAQQFTAEGIDLGVEVPRGHPASVPERGRRHHTPMATATAIPAHLPAGGLLLAGVEADQRVMPNTSRRRPTRAATTTGTR